MVMRLQDLWRDDVSDLKPVIQKVRPPHGRWTSSLLMCLLLLAFYSDAYDRPSSLWHLHEQPTVIQSRKD